MFKWSSADNVYYPHNFMNIVIFVQKKYYDLHTSLNIKLKFNQCPSRIIKKDEHLLNEE